MNFESYPHERVLKCELDPPEVAEHAAAAGEANLKRDECLEEVEKYKAAAKGAKTLAEGHDLDARRHLRCVNTRSEERPVDCVTEWNPETKLIVTYRTDTSEYLSEREPTPEEKQQSLDLEKRPDQSADSAEEEFETKAGFNTAGEADEVEEFRDGGMAQRFTDVDPPRRTRPGRDPKLDTPAS